MVTFTIPAPIQGSIAEAITDQLFSPLGFYEFDDESHISLSFKANQMDGY
jgi:hypothetical protein